MHPEKFVAIAILILLSGFSSQGSPQDRAGLGHGKEVDVYYSLTALMSIFVDSS